MPAHQPHISGWSTLQPKAERLSIHPNSLPNVINRVLQGIEMLSLPSLDEEGEGIQRNGKGLSSASEAVYWQPIFFWGTFQFTT